jgi:hypothetical protein
MTELKLARLNKDLSPKGIGYATFLPRYENDMRICETVQILDPLGFGGLSGQCCVIAEREENRDWILISIATHSAS